MEHRKVVLDVDQKSGISGVVNVIEGFLVLMFCLEADKIQGF